MAQTTKVRKPRPQPKAKAKASPKVKPKAPAKPGQQGEVKLAIKPAAFRMEKVARKERFLKLLIYGGYGVGKTTLAASANEVPAMRGVFLANAESGDLSIDVDNQEDMFKVEVTSFKLLSKVHEYLKSHCRARDADDTDAMLAMQAQLMDVDEDEIDEPTIFRTAIVDTLTEIEAYCFNQLLGVTDITRIDEETETAEFKEYKQNNGMILRLVRKFRDLPMHVIFTCAEQYVQDENKKMKYSPDMTGKLSKKIQGFMDMVGYLQVGRNEQGGILRRLHVAPSTSGKFDAKHRYQSFKGSHFDNPTIGKILREVGLLSKDGTSLK